MGVYGHGCVWPAGIHVPLTFTVPSRQSVLRSIRFGRGHHPSSQAVSILFLFFKVSRYVFVSDVCCVLCYWLPAAAAAKEQRKNPLSLLLLAAARAARAACAASLGISLANQPSP